MVWSFVLTVCARVRIASVQQLNAMVVELSNLLILGLPIPKNFSGSPDYNRTSYRQHASDKKAGLRSLYNYTFQLAKPEYVLRSLSSRVTVTDLVSCFVEEDGVSLWTWLSTSGLPCSERSTP